MLFRAPHKSGRAVVADSGPAEPAVATYNPLLLRIVVCTVLLTVFGLLITTDATVGTARYGNIPLKQISFLPLAVIAFVLGYWVRPRAWRTLSGGMVILGLSLLVIVLFPGLSHSSRGASRWLEIAGFTFHPMELFKFAFIIFSAHMFATIAQKRLTPAQGLTRLLLFFFLGAGLIAMEPDVDAIIILAFLLVGMALASRAFSVKALLRLAVAGLIVMALFVVAAMSLRGTSWGTALSKDKYDVTQAKYAIASGGIVRLAPGSSIQKYYIPEPHNDFAFAIAVEELGAAGGIVLILIYMALVFAGLEISKRFEDQPFESTLAMGISMLIGGQVFLNTAVATGLVPVAGLPLPLVSYGYTAMVMNMIELGILARLAHATVRIPVSEASPARMPPPVMRAAGTGSAAFFSSVAPRDARK